MKAPIGSTIAYDLAFCYIRIVRDVTYSGEARNTLRKMPVKAARLIERKIRQYAADPDSLRNNVKALKGAGRYCRLRIGDWRVIFSEDGKVVAVVRIADRADAYD